MADGVLVLLLLALIWAAILVPPAAGAHAAREAEFLGSIRPEGDPHEPTGANAFEGVDEPRFRPALSANARRRQVLGGLVVATGATLVLGLVPTFHILLVVHLLMLNSCLAYVGLLVHLRDERAAHSEAAARAPWHDDFARQAAREAEDDYTHAYDAYTVPADDDEYEDEFTAEIPAYRSAMASTPASAYAYADDGYADDGYVDDEAEESLRWAEAEAAFVDDELGLARPA
ncbi:MAG: hypothetical protein QOE93_137 [Actinomycetota bacterium]|jgi:hypothetical protein|nr:hypothetical protein [Actinomycetota bacterium]